jgi:hypothetical protein
VYAGLGEVHLAPSKRARGAGETDRARDLATSGVLAYLQVSESHPEYAEREDLLRAYEGVARLFGDLFALSDERDCDAAERSYAYYRRAVDMLDPNDPERRRLVGEGRALDARFRASCCEEGR